MTFPSLSGVILRVRSGGRGRERGGSELWAGPGGGDGGRQAVRFAGEFT